ncbi:MAG: response regulator transcription factor [Spirochaetales bacterium]|nr:response regulator transcription factor [Spirochaetales bacterium]
MERSFLLVDDHPVFRQGLASLLETIDNYRVTGEAGDWDEAVALLREKEFHIMIVDISLKDRDGLELLNLLSERENPPVALVLSMHDESSFAEKSLEAGALGYVMKHAPPEEILDAVETVLRGERFLSARMKQQILDARFDRIRNDDQSRLDSLSPREREILDLIGQGFGATEIAEKLNLSVKTIHTYRDHLKEKLDMDTARQVRRFAIQRHIGSST